MQCAVASDPVLALSCSFSDWVLPFQGKVSLLKLYVYVGYFFQSLENVYFQYLLAFGNQPLSVIVRTPGTIFENCVCIIL